MYFLDSVAIFVMPYFRKSDFDKMMPTIGSHTASKYLHYLSEPYVRRDGTTAQILQMRRQGRENIYFNQALFDVMTQRF
jgi:hypothetical protein